MTLGVGAPVSSVAAAVTWNPSDKDSGITLTNGNLTADGGSGAFVDVRGTVSHSTGKYIMQMTNLNAPMGHCSSSCSFGIANSTASLTAFMGTNNNSLALIDGGTRWFLNNTNIGVGPTWNNMASTDVLCLAIDMDNKKAWARINAGNWNLSGTDDPATNTGGVTWSTIAAGPWFPALTLFQSVNSADYKFDGTSCGANAPSSGFTGW